MMQNIRIALPDGHGGVATPSLIQLEPNPISRPLALLIENTADDQSARSRKSQQKGKVPAGPEIIGASCSLR